MTADADEDALSWGPEADSTHIEGAPGAAVATKEGKSPRAGSGDAVLISYGIMGGIYLLYTIAWIIIAIRTNSATPTGNALTDAVTPVTAVLAVFAPPCWFVASLALNRGRKSRVVLLYLVIGIIVLLPWIFVTGVAA